MKEYDPTNIEGLSQRTRMCFDCPGRPTGKRTWLMKMSHDCHNNIETQACAANLVGTSKESLVMENYYREIGF